MGQLGTEDETICELNVSRESKEMRRPVHSFLVLKQLIPTPAPGVQYLPGRSSSVDPIKQAIERDGSSFALKLTFVAVDSVVYHADFFPTRPHLNAEEYGGGVNGVFSPRQSHTAQGPDSIDILAREMMMADRVNMM